MKFRRRRGGILNSYPKLGPILYVAGIQYFVVQLISALRWSPPYSISRDTISDLGNTACGTWNGRYVCSPSHNLMNWSFVVLGAAIPFVLGNIALLVLALALEIAGLARVYFFLSGGVALLALVAYASSHYLGLGEGGIERFVAYPQTVCLVVIGCYLIVKSSVSSPPCAAGAPGTATATIGPMDFRTPGEGGVP